MKRPILITLAGAAIGAAAGWLYWRFVGCASGSCSITSSALNSSLYGALLGGLLFNGLRPTKRGPSSSTTN